MRNKKMFLAICVFLVVALAFTGCRPAERPLPEENALPQEQAQPDGRPADDIRDPQVTEDPRQEPRNTQPGERNQDLSIRADRIVEEVARLEEVRSATVVISDTTAVVGVNLVEDTAGEMDRGLETRIEDVVRETDRNIDNVAVTADPDLFTRIENIAREAAEGRPLSGFGREIEELVRRITPKV